MITSTTLKLIIKAQDDASRIIKGVNSQLQKAGWTNEKLARTARVAGTAMTGMAAVLGGLAVKASMNLEQAVANAVSVTGVFGDEADEAKKKVSELAKVLGQETAFTATEAADALYDLASKGRDVASMVKGDLLPFLDLAAATQSDLASTTQMVNETLNQFRMTVGDSGRVSDVFAKAIGSSSLKMDTLSEAMSYSGAVAKGFGLDVETTTALMGALADAGFHGSRAGTALKNAFTKLSQQTPTLEGVLAKYGMTLAEVNPETNKLTDVLKKLEEAGITATDSIKIFGQIGGPAMMALLAGGIDSVDELETALRDAGGTARKMADDQLATLQGQLKLLKSSAEGLLIAVGDKLIPILTKMASKLMNWINDNKQLATTILTVTVAFLAIGGPILMFLGFLPNIISGVKLVKIAIGGLGKAMLWLAANPIVLIIAGLVALIYGIYQLIKHWDEFKVKTIEVWKKISTFMDTTLGKIITVLLGPIGAVLTIIKYWDKLKEKTVKVWNDILNFIKTTVDKIGDILQTCIDKTKSVIDFFKEIPEKVKNNLSSVQGIIEKAFSVDKNVLLESTAIALENLKDSIYTYLGDISYDIQNWFKKTYKDFMLGFGDLSYKIQNWFTTTYNDFMLGLGNWSYTIQNWFKTVYNKFMLGFGDLSYKIQNWFTTTYDDFMVGLGNWSYAIQDWFKSVYSNFMVWFGDLSYKIQDWWSHIGENAIESFSEAVGETVEKEKPNMLLRIGDALAAIAIALPLLLIVGFIHLGWKLMSFIIDGIKSLNIIEGIKSIFESIKENIMGWGTSFYDWGKGLIQRLIDGIKSIPVNIGSFIGDTVNDVKDAWTSLPANLSQTFAPMTELANGGIVTRPTNALIGEAGPEAVIPLDRLSDDGGNLGLDNTVVNNYSFNFTGAHVGDKDSLISEIKNAIDRSYRLQSQGV